MPLVLPVPTLRLFPPLDGDNRAIGPVIDSNQVEQTIIHAYRVDPRH